MTAMELVHSSRDNLVGGENLKIKQLGTEKLSDTIHDVEGKGGVVQVVVQIVQVY